MVRIYLDYSKNLFLEYPDVFMLFVFMIASLTMVSIGDVMVNLPKNDPGAMMNFLINALRNTSIIIQILIAGFFVRVIVVSVKKIAHRHEHSGKLQIIN